ncbi:MAG: glycosyltransferase, partial [bacterium]
AGVDARVVAGDMKVLTRRTVWQHRPWAHIRPVRGGTWREVGAVPTLFFGFLAAYPPWWGWIAARSYRREVKRLAPWIRSTFRFDVVHAHTAFLDGGAGAWLARRFSVPFILTEHTGPFSALTDQPVMRRQTEQAINRADAVIAVSETLKKDILGRIRVRDATRVRVLGNGVDPGVFRPDGTRPPPDGTVRALWIGGFLPVKQPLMLIDAFAAARLQQPQLRMSMVGTGPLEAEIRERIRSRDVEREVSVLSSATRPAVADYMRRHHFLVMSSESETFGLVALEALACGRPVLTTRCGGPEETVRSGRYGELVGNSVADLSKGFVTMAGRLPEFDERVLHDYARRNYSFEVIAARLKETYLEIVRNKETS